MPDSTRRNADGPADEHPDARPLAGRVLLIDDSRTIRSFLSRTLAGVGFEAIEAENGQEGLRAVVAAHQAGAPVDLVLCDLNMPVLDGLNFLKRLRAMDDYRLLPVVMLSSETDRETIVECARYNISTYLLKPCKTGHLLETVRSALADSALSCCQQAAAATLSPADIDALDAALRHAAEEAIRNGVSVVHSPDTEPVYAAFRKFIRTKTGGRDAA